MSEKQSKKDILEDIRNENVIGYISQREECKCLLVKDLKDQEEAISLVLHSFLEELKKTTTDFSKLFSEYKDLYYKPFSRAWILSNENLFLIKDEKDLTNSGRIDWTNPVVIADINLDTIKDLKGVYINSKKEVKLKAEMHNKLYYLPDSYEMARDLLISLMNVLIQETSTTTEEKRRANMYRLLSFYPLGNLVIEFIENYLVYHARENEIKDFDKYVTPITFSIYKVVKEIWIVLIKHIHDIKYLITEGSVYIFSSEGDYRIKEWERIQLEKEIEEDE